jgi:hypothetical protein
MRKYELGDLALVLSGVIAGLRDLKIADQLSISTTRPDFFSILASNLDGLSIMCRSFDADPALIFQLVSLRDSVANGKERRPGVLHAQLNDAIEGVQHSLESRLFMLVPPGRSPYWETPELFWRGSLGSFPEAIQVEAIEAGACFAAARWTACVFHCMRIAEHGLRKLARLVGATITHNGKPYPVEFGEWEKIINAVKTKLAPIRQLPRGAKRERKLKFYSDAADHCSYMKDIWRNEISHARRNYNEAEALGAMHRVRDFMELISKPPR